METQAPPQIVPQRSAKEQFDKQAAQYNAQWNTWSEAILSSMLSIAQPEPTDTVLDVATGTGFTALAYAPLVRSVVGLDVSPGMLKQAEQYARERGAANAVFQEGAAEELPFADHSFDIVTCRIAPHHFLDVRRFLSFLDVRRFLSETARVLRPGGSLVLANTTVPGDLPEAAEWQNRVETMRDPSHVRNYTPGRWRRMAEAAGLAVAECCTGGGGITIPLSDWLVKAGCTPEQSAEVRQCFAQAPPGARKAFQIVTQPGGETVFTWQRVLLKAVKPGE